MTIDSENARLNFTEARHGTSLSIAGEVSGFVKFHRVEETCISPLLMDTPLTELESEVVVIRDFRIFIGCAKRLVARP